MNQFYTEQSKLYIDALKKQQPERGAEIRLPDGEAVQVEQTPPTVGHPRVSVLGSVVEMLRLGKRREAMR